MGGVKVLAEKRPGEDSYRIERGEGELGDLPPRPCTALFDADFAGLLDDDFRGIRVPQRLRDRLEQMPQCRLTGRLTRLLSGDSCQRNQSAR